jgi:hypothetical protein
MRCVSIFLLVVAVLSLCNHSFAQDSRKGAELLGDGYDYIKDAKIDAVIFRGPTTIKYPFRFTGSVYAYSDEFLEGRVYYNKKEFAGVKMNLNSNRDELCVQMYGTGMIIVLDKKYVKNFSFGGHNFINHTAGDGIDGLDYGYYEVLYSGKDLLLKRIRQVFNEKVGVDASGTSILKHFYPVYNYYIVRDGKVISIKKRGDFAKIYKEQKSAIKQHIKAHNMHLAGKEANDKVFVSIMQFIGSKEVEL